MYELLQNGWIRLLDAHHEIAERTVDILTPALYRAVVGRVADVDGDGSGLLVVTGPQSVQLGMSGKDHSRFGVLRGSDISGAHSGHSGSFDTGFAA